LHFTASIVLTGSKNPEKSVDFSGFLQLFDAFPFCAFGLTQILTHTGKLPDSTGEEAADRIGGFRLHRGGHVGIGVQSEASGVVAQHSGQSFDIHTVLEGQDGERMPQRAEGDLLQSCPLQYPLEHMQDAVRGDRTSGGGREDVLAGGLPLHLAEKFHRVGSYRYVAVGIFRFQGRFHYGSVLAKNLPLDTDNAFLEVNIAPFQP